MVAAFLYQVHLLSCLQLVTTTPCRIHPVLNLTGELDGQQPVSKQAWAFLDAATNAAKLTLRHVAAFQPVIFIPGALSRRKPQG